MNESTEGKSRSSVGNDSNPAVRWFVLVLRLAVSALLIAWLVSVIDVAAALPLLRAVRVPQLAASVVCVLATLIATCWRWRLCLLEEGRRLPWRVIVVSYWTSMFAGTLLPTEFGGDLLQIKDIWSRLESASMAVVSVFWSRISGVGAMFFVFNLIGLFRMERLAELSIMCVWAFSVVIFIALTAFVLLCPASGSVKSLLKRCPGPEKLRISALQVLERAQALALHRQYAWRIAASALFVQALMIASNCLFASALDQPVDVWDMALVVPLVGLSSLLPVSLGGIGVKEGAFVVCLSVIGLSQEGALAIALLNRLVVLFVALVGGCLFPFRSQLLGKDT